jgi:hypothetical protein
MELKMWTLMKKNVFMFVLICGSIMGLNTVYLLFVRKTLNTNILIFLGQILMYCVLASVMTSEKAEEKNNGYAFMNHLPIKNRDIVASKFAVLLATVVFLCVYTSVLISFMKTEPYMFPLSRIFLFLCGNLGLILAGGMYILIYRWGYTTFMKISVLGVIILMVGPFLFIEFVLVRQNIDYGAFLQSLNDLPWMIWLIVTAVTLAIFWILLQVAVKAKQSQRGK